ncbi:unnamed protein product, partial [marine sediment metagenome]
YIDYNLVYCISYFVYRIRQRVFNIWFMIYDIRESRLKDIVIMNYIK